MKKIIKVKLIGFEQFDPNLNTVMQLLSELYDVEIVDENPEYIICSMFGIPYEYCKYPQIRIMLSGENFIPDFNIIDYAISSYPITYLDRAYRLPVFMFTFYDRIETLKSKDRNYSVDVLNGKVYFANFISSHESENNIRGDFFKKLCEYKRVESPGTYLNNMPDGEIVTLSNKKDFQSKCKFTLCFESTKHEGFITEKITDAFLADTIPVYYGSSDIGEIFNKNAFIDVSDYASFDDAINKIIRLDNDDEKYLEMLKQPIFTDPEYCNNVYSGLRGFLKNIFDQPIEKAYRRSRVFRPARYNNYLQKCYNNSLLECLEKEKSLKKRDFINDLKSIKSEKGILFAFLYWIKHLGGVIS